MEKKRFKRWAYEDYDPEEIEEAHTMKLKASNLEMEKDVLASSLSALIVGCSYEDFDPEETEEAHISKATYLEMETNTLIDIEKLQQSFEAAKDCCIYRVPRDLRKINEKAYTPQVVSIGPLHHGKEEYLIEMEKQKLRYVKKFGERTSMDKLEELRSFIETNERKIRSFYAENSNLSSGKFVKMILCDAIFIIELLLRNDQRKTRPEFDIFLDKPIRKAAVKLDLQLIENQLPYFVLKELCVRLDVVKPRGEVHLLILASQFFFDCDKDHLIDDADDIQHFTDLRRRFLLKQFSLQNNIERKHIRDLPRATKLHESGVKFEKGIEISCEYINRSLLRIIPCIKLQELELRIPRFEVYDGTECLIRNVMAFEQLHYPWKTHLCNYILLMDFLIDNEKDVDLLVDKGIIFNCLGDNAAIANMFNKLGLQVTPSYSSYYNVAKKLIEHNGKRWNHAKATLKSVYFRDPWIGTGTVVAALLLLLTLVQTICSILQVL